MLVWFSRIIYLSEFETAQKIYERCKSDIDSLKQAQSKKKADLLRLREKQESVKKDISKEIKKVGTFQTNFCSMRVITFMKKF